MTTYDQKIQNMIKYMTNTCDQNFSFESKKCAMKCFRSERTPLPPFGISSKIHPFLRIQASLTHLLKGSKRASAEEDKGVS